MTDGDKHLLFIWTPGGYELREADGSLPQVGDVLAVDDREERVSKIGPSPLPGDARLCAYLQAT
jgi:hypothetical protein